MVGEKKARYVLLGKYRPPYVGITTPSPSLAELSEVDSLLIVHMSSRHIGIIISPLTVRDKSCVPDSRCMSSGAFISHRSVHVLGIRDWSITRMPSDQH